MRGTLTPGGKMEGADESTELWRHPKQDLTKAVKLKIRSNGPARHGAAFSSRKRNFTFFDRNLFDGRNCEECLPSVVIRLAKLNGMNCRLRSLQSHQFGLFLKSFGDKCL